MDGKGRHIPPGNHTYTYKGIHFNVFSIQGSATELGSDPGVSKYSELSVYRVLSTNGPVYILTWLVSSPFLFFFLKYIGVRLGRMYIYPFLFGSLYNKEALDRKLDLYMVISGELWNIIQCDISNIPVLLHIDELLSWVAFVSPEIHTACIGKEVSHGIALRRYTILRVEYK